MNEHLSGEGDVFVQKTGAHVARARYDVTYTHPGQGHLGRIEADVALDRHLAGRLFNAGDLLTLRLSDGRSFDFFVQGVSGSDAVAIRPKGGLRSAT